jgi:glycosyltransferase involved in cell wall biosynthesis
MNINPKITVYITNHNYGKYIIQAIESVLGQTFKDFELIIVDDGSTDNSRQILKEYEKTINTKIIYQGNRGLSISNNIALKQARGEYIIRLDADDYLDKNALKILINEFDDENIGMVFGDWYLINQKGDILGIEKRHDFDKDVSLYDQPAHGACTMFRTKFLKKIGGYDEGIACQDGYELWFRFIAEYEIRNISIPIFYYRKHGLSLTDKSEELLNTRSQIFRKIVERENKPLTKAVAIFPVRGEKLDRRSMPFLKISNDYLIDISINNYLKAEGIDRVVVTTPDRELVQYIEHNYDKNIVFAHYRSPDISYIGTNISKTMKLIQDDLNIKKNYDAFVTHSIETPFLSTHFIESAINVFRIFDIDTVIAVKEDDAFYFKHNGHGMIPINYSEDIIRYEKEKWYKNVTGFQLRDTKTYFKDYKMLGDKIGHISLNKKAAFTIEDDFDLKIVNYI